MKQPRIDPLLFGVASAAVVLVCVLLGLFPERAESYVSDLYDWVAGDVGVLYQIFGLVTIGFLLWLSFSRHGHIRLGGDKPEYSLFSWVGMLFCAGTGASC